MIDISLKEGLQKLKARFTGEDVHPDAITQIKQWEEALAKLSEQEKFVELETTKKIKTALKERLKNTIRKRIVESHTPEEKEMMNMLRWLSPNVESEIESIRQAIELELSE